MLPDAVQKAALEDAKDRIKAACLGPTASNYQQWQAWQLVLTSGGTEANNLALAWFDHGRCTNFRWSH